MEIKKSFLKKLVKEIYNKHQILVQENKIRSLVRENIKSVLNELDDDQMDSEDKQKEFDEDPRNPLNKMFKKANPDTGQKNAVATAYNDADHPFHDKAVEMINKYKEKHPDYEVHAPGEIPAPGGPQSAPDTVPGEGDDDGETGSVFSDDEEETEISPDDQYDDDPKKSPSYIYGGDSSKKPELPSYARDLPHHWKELAHMGMEDEIATGKRAAPFVYKTKKKYFGKRQTAGGER